MNDVVLKRKRTEDGYALTMVCPRCHKDIRRIDPQAPIWTLPVIADEHKAKAHSVPTHDDAVGKVYYRYPERGVENLSLPDET